MRLGKGGVTKCLEAAIKSWSSTREKQCQWVHTQDHTQKAAQVSSIVSDMNTIVVVYPVGGGVLCKLEVLR